jgi:hypothetical protein
MATVIWDGFVDQQHFRVVDAGSSVSPRLTVEMAAGPDAMGGARWQTFDPLPTRVFEGVLIGAGILT